MRGMSGGIDLERRYRLEDLDTFPEDGRRFELADGWLLVSPMARRKHQLGCKRIGEALEAACTSELFVFGLAIQVMRKRAGFFA